MEVRLSQVRVDLAAVLRQEEQRLTQAALRLRTGSPKRQDIKERLEVLEEYITMLENEPAPLILKIQTEFPKGRIRL